MFPLKIKKYSEFFCSAINWLPSDITATSQKLVSRWSGIDETNVILLLQSTFLLLSATSPDDLAGA